jgi:hypothetical protein
MAARLAAEWFAICGGCEVTILGIGEPLIDVSPPRHMCTSSTATFVCHRGDCHYQEGNYKTEKRAEAIRLMLADFAVEEERFRLEWVSAAEGPRFAQIVREFTEQVQKLGVSPYRS